MEFSVFGKAVAKQFDLMSKQVEMFTVDADKYEMFDTYLAAFPEGTNEMHITNTQHDCNCCKQFIRGVGNAVAFIDGEMVTVWDVEVGGFYQVVADAMSAFIKTHAIRTLFRRDEQRYGAEVTKQFIQDLEAIPPVELRIDWNHFYCHIPSKFVIKDGSLGSFIGKANNNYKVLKRSLTEITPEAIDIVTDLIASNAIHRGAEQKAKVTKLKLAMTKYNGAENKEEALWILSSKLGNESAFRNTSIGTLLVDLSDGVELEIAVKKYEDKVSGVNFKRSSALITEGMKVKAFEKVQELGLEDATYRRFAVAEDITIDNVLFADNSVRESLGAFDLLGKTHQKATEQKIEKAEAMTITEFIRNVLPRIDTMEMMVAGGNTGNLVSLIAPTYLNAGNLFKWDNNFSFSYNGEVADSMKAQVAAAGGKVDGELRFSIRWNEDGTSNSDLDAHCIEPSGNLIHYPSKGQRHTSTGMLDVDITNPGNKVAVENITYIRAPGGKYQFIVHNYKNNSGNSGFTAEVEYKGELTQFVYHKPVTPGQKIGVAACTINGGKIKFGAKGLKPTTITSEVWGIETGQYHKVNMVMNSPNYWDGQSEGNQQYFFMLDKCINPDPARGFYNEFLRNDLHDHRKVFEVLGSKLKTEVSTEQLSGLGFSVTKRDSVLVKVRGSFNRTIKINF